MYKWLLLAVLFLGSCVSVSEFPNIRQHYVQLVSYDNYSCGGVILEDNRVLTAHHCITRGDGELLYKGNRIPYKVIKEGDFMKSPDLAVLDARVKGTCLVYGENPKEKDPVFVYSSPMNLKNLYSHGIVSSVSALARDMYGEYGYFMIHTAHISAGSSGSGVFDKKGGLIGINARIANNFSLAVPVQQIREFYALSEKRC